PQRRIEILTIDPLWQRPPFPPLVRPLPHLPRPLLGPLLPPRRDRPKSHRPKPIPAPYHLCPHRLQIRNPHRPVLIGRRIEPHPHWIPRPRPARRALVPERHRRERLPLEHLPIPPEDPIAPHVDALIDLPDHHPRD